MKKLKQELRRSLAPFPLTTYSTAANATTMIENEDRSKMAQWPTQPSSHENEGVFSLLQTFCSAWLLALLAVSLLLSLLIKIIFNNENIPSFSFVLSSHHEVFQDKY
jgi:hypothetical protein